VPGGKCIDAVRFKRPLPCPVARGSSSGLDAPRSTVKTHNPRSAASASASSRPGAMMGRSAKGTPPGPTSRAGAIGTLT